MKKSHFSTNILLLLGNDTRYGHSYYRMWIGNHTNLSNDTILNDLEWPLTQISRSRYYSTSNNSKMVPLKMAATAICMYHLILGKQADYCRSAQGLFSPPCLLPAMGATGSISGWWSILLNLGYSSAHGNIIKRSRKSTSELWNKSWTFAGTQSAKNQSMVLLINSSPIVLNVDHRVLFSLILLCRLVAYFISVKILPWQWHQYWIFLSSLLTSC